MNLNKMTKDELLNQLKTEQIDINQLNLSVKAQREAFFDVIKIRPALLSKISGINERHFLLPAIEQNPALFVYLNNKQYTDELAQLYLSYRLNNSDDKKNTGETNFGLIAQKSIDNKVLLNYSYMTREGEELYYYDNELQVPASIKSYFKATLKIVNAVTLINKFDLHITQLGENKIKATLTDIFDNQYKAFLSSYIANHKIGYYTLCTTLSDFEEAFKTKISEVFKPYGIELTNFIIRKLAIPKDIQYKLEDQAFQIRQLKADNEANNEFAKMSLENYEKKLAIQEKYPGAEHSLTEYEKDLALKRYLIKHGRNDTDKINHTININKGKDSFDEAIDKKKDIELEIPTKVNGARVAYFVTMGILAFISLILILVAPGPGLIVMGMLTATYGLIGGLCYEKLKPYKNDVDLTGQNVQAEVNETNTASEVKDTAPAKEEGNE